MTTAHIVRKPEPCNQTPPEHEGDKQTHFHVEDGRVCWWDPIKGEWVTVNSRHESVGEAEPQEVPKGLYPKFFVKRVDGRDAPGGDRHDAQQAYFVLDPIFDPHARPALALYALVARERGDVELADDIEANLRQINAYVGSVVEEGADPESLKRPLRVVATFTYPGYRAHYLDEESGQPMPVHDMARVDEQNLRDGTVTLIDADSWGDDPGGESISVLPDA